MILGITTQSDRYSALHPLFARGIDFVEQQRGNLTPGRYEIDGDNLFVMIVDTTLKDKSEATLEVHNKYIDIQLIIKGVETFAWADRDKCKAPRGEFDTQNDIGFFEDSPSNYIKASDGEFVVFFPEDAHAPLIGTGRVIKAIIKVKCL